uniref:DUF148 domain-containing protein n=1 Tax=Parastrongyloides trichosuri TaxID=131310 RepID=A0A0N5A2R7_PARTI
MDSSNRRCFGVRGKKSSHSPERSLSNSDFFKQVPDDVRDNISQIVKDDNLSLNERQCHIDNLMKDQNDEVKTSYHEYKSQMDSMKQHGREKTDDYYNNLSDKAKPYFNQMKDLHENRDIKESDKHGKLREIYDSIDDNSARRELDHMLRIKELH